MYIGGFTFYKYFIRYNTNYIIIVNKHYFHIFIFLYILFINYIISGFWEAYLGVREFVHTVLRKELSQNPAEVFFTGHSLGGALANLAVVDVSIHTIPRINAFLRRKSLGVESHNSSGSLVSHLSQSTTSTTNSFYSHSAIHPIMYCNKFV
jgi:hypothetical protein